MDYKKKFRNEIESNNQPLKIFVKYLTICNVIDFDKKSICAALEITSLDNDFINEKIKLSTSYPVQNVNFCLDCRFFNLFMNLTKKSIRSQTSTLSFYPLNLKNEDIKPTNNELNFCSYCPIFIWMASLRANIFSNFPMDFIDHIIFKVISFSPYINNTATQLLKRNFSDLIDSYLLKNETTNKNKFFIAPLLNDYYLYNSFLIKSKTNIIEKVLLIYREEDFNKSPVFSMVSEKLGEVISLVSDFKAVLLPLEHVKHADTLLEFLCVFKDNNIYSYYTKIPEYLKVKILSFYFPFKILYTIMQSILSPKEEDFELFLIANDNIVSKKVINKVGEIMGALCLEKDFIDIKDLNC